MQQNVKPAVRCLAGACLLWAAFGLVVEAASTTVAKGPGRELDVVVVPSGFRVHGVYVSRVEDVLTLVDQTKPSAVKIKVCVFTPEHVVTRVQALLYDRFDGGQHLERLGKRDLDCRFPNQPELHANQRLWK